MVPPRAGMAWGVSVAALVVIAGQAVGLAQPPAPAPSTPPPATVGTPESRNPAIAPYENRIVRDITIKGLKVVSEQLVRNQIRTVAGRPLKSETVEGDISRLVRLGRFREVQAKVQPYADQSVAVEFEVAETAVIKDVQASGNRQVSDQDINAEVNILAGTPLDRYQIDRALRKIKDLYLKRGYYQADVTVDEKELEESGILLFRIREGERLRITDIRFEGNAAYGEGLLFPNVKTKTWDFLFNDGALDDNQLDQDIAALISYYKDRGYLDVRVDRQIRPSPDGREAIITFIIEEGPVYTMRSVRAELEGEEGFGSGKPPVVFSPEQIAGLVTIKVGDVYSQDKIRKSIEAISDAYGQQGYADIRVKRAELRDPNRPEVDLLVLLREGRKYKTGQIVIKGNELTQQGVIRRQLRVYPERPLNTVAIRESEERLRDVNLFAGSRNDGPPPQLTVQPENPDDPGYRDVLVTMKETNTGSLSFGAAVSSDAGLVGTIGLNQRNFDVADWPDSLDELISGRAFRGAGQEFNINLSPGTETQNYTVSLTDPYLFESNFSGTIAGGLTSRNYDEYDERRIGGQLSFGRRFGKVWSGQLTTRIQDIDVSNVNDDSILDLQEIEGQNLLTGVGLRLRRSTLNSGIKPSKGTRVDLGIERVGALGGDYNFTKLSASGTAYLTVFEDFVGRKTVLSFRTATQYIPEDVSNVPLFERYFLGGRELRGFGFRGVSPRGLRPGANPGDPPVVSNDPSGGTWSFFLGAELEQPLVQQIISGVVFIDSGTVTTEPGFDDYRVSVGVGVRLYIPQLGPVPLAFDFGFPLRSQPGDDKQLFSFSLDVPF